MATVKKGDTVVLVGTRKGLFLFHSRDRKRWSSRGPYFEGDTIRHAILDPDDGKTVFAGVLSEHWGPVVGIQNRVTDRVAFEVRTPRRPPLPNPRSEERRVGKECRSRCSPYR